MQCYRRLEDGSTEYTNTGKIGLPSGTGYSESADSNKPTVSKDIQWDLHDEEASVESPSDAVQVQLCDAYATGSVIVDNILSGGFTFHNSHSDDSNATVSWLPAQSSEPAMPTVDLCPWVAALTEDPFLAGVSSCVEAGGDEIDDRSIQAPGVDLGDSSSRAARTQEESCIISLDTKSGVVALNHTAHAYLEDCEQHLGDVKEAAEENFHAAKAALAGYECVDAQGSGTVAWKSTASTDSLAWATVTNPETSTTHPEASLTHAWPCSSADVEETNSTINGTDTCPQYASMDQRKEAAAVHDADEGRLLGITTSDTPQYSTCELLGAPAHLEMRSWEGTPSVTRSTWEGCSHGAQHPSSISGTGAPEFRLRGADLQCETQNSHPFRALSSSGMQHAETKDEAKNVCNASIDLNLIRACRVKEGTEGNTSLTARGDRTPSPPTAQCQENANEALPEEHDMVNPNGQWALKQPLLMLVSPLKRLARWSCLSPAKCTNHSDECSSTISEPNDNDQRISIATESMLSPSIASAIKERQDRFSSHRRSRASVGCASRKSSRSSNPSPKEPSRSNTATAVAAAQLVVQAQQLLHNAQDDQDDNVMHAFTLLTEGRLQHHMA